MTCFWEEIGKKNFKMANIIWAIWAWIPCFICKVQCVFVFCSFLFVFFFSLINTCPHLLASRLLHTWGIYKTGENNISLFLLTVIAFHSFQFVTADLKIYLQINSLLLCDLARSPKFREFWSTGSNLSL